MKYTRRLRLRLDDRFESALLSPILLRVHATNRRSVLLGHGVRIAEDVAKNATRLQDARGEARGQTTKTRGEIRGGKAGTSQRPPRVDFPILSLVGRDIATRREKERGHLAFSRKPRLSIALVVRLKSIRADRVSRARQRRRPRIEAPRDLLSTPSCTH